MASYLGFTEMLAECSGCARHIPPGLVGFTDELTGPGLEPVCPACLDGMERRLVGVQQCVREAGRKLLGRD